MIRLHRLLEPKESKQVDLDSKIPNDLDEMNIEIIFWNADASVETKIDSINLIAF